MKRIRQIIICGEKWRVEIVPPSHPEIKNYSGRCYHDKNKIIILEGNEKGDTILHELCEAVFYRSALKYECSNGNGVPESIVIMNHGQMNNAMRDAWGALNQIFELRDKK